MHVSGSKGQISVSRSIESRQVWKRWGEFRELQSVPKIVPETIDDNSEYQIHIPMDLYIKPGQRQKNLRNPKPGPSFNVAEELSPLVFGHESPNEVSS